MPGLVAFIVHTTRTLAQAFFTALYRCSTATAADNSQISAIKISSKVRLTLLLPCLTIDSSCAQLCAISSYCSCDIPVQSSA
jgi:hypothetical protein